MEVLCEGTPPDNRYLELETDVGLKSRMRENRTYGSVRGSRQAFHAKILGMECRDCLLDWSIMHFEYCPHCGSKLIKKEIGDEGLIPFCEKCNVPLWDMFTTSIIAAVVNEEKEIALIRQNYVSTTNYVCVAGIMKIGESAEETVIREVKEEIGQDVIEVEFIKSYPYEKKEMLMLGYKASVKKADFVLSGEVDSVRWVKYEDALNLLREGSIAWQLVKTVIEA